MRLLPFSLALVCLLQAVSAAPLPDVKMIARYRDLKPREAGLEVLPSYLKKRTDHGQPDWPRKDVRGQPQPDWRTS